MKRIAIYMLLGSSSLMLGNVQAQSPSPFVNYGESNGVYQQGKPSKSPEAFGDRIPGSVQEDMDGVWLYINSKSAEYAKTGEITHFGRQLASIEVAALAQVVLEYKEKYRDDTNARIEKMCSAYQSGESAEQALQYMETGEQLRARWGRVGKEFLAAIEASSGRSFAQEISFEVQKQKEITAFFSARTTRDILDSERMNKDAYVINACSGK